jgi:hypothetical protein
MRKGSYGTRLGASLAVAVLAVGLAAAPSLATTAKTWTVKPGGSFSGRSGKVTLTDTATGVALFCKSSSLSGKLKSGRGLPSTHIASITAFSISSCLGPLGNTYTVTTGIFPYYLDTKSYDTARGETTATVTGIRAFMQGFGCFADIDGTTLTTGGIIKGEYANSTHKLQIITSGSTLQLYNASSGCLGLFNNGDPMTISGTYTITPKQAITSP